MARWRKVVFPTFGVLFILFFFAPIFRVTAQLSTGDHLAEPGFWPTQSAQYRKDFVGAETCATCHATIFASQKSTPMGATAMHAENSEILHSHPNMDFGFGPFHYSLKVQADQTGYAVTDGKETQTANLQWAFGTGRVGQSYLFKKRGEAFYEARITYFSSLHNLNFTPARAMTSAKDVALNDAMYREVGAAEVGRCFACHTTASAIDGKFDEANLIPGVSCEACHGPGAEHVAAMRTAKVTGESGGSTQIFNPVSLHPPDSVDFCGACHATTWDVKLSGIKGVSTARSQPYRLQKSKCWGNGDARLTCIGCHDPHKQLQMESTAYDANCLSCHSGSAKIQAAGSQGQKMDMHAGKTCPVATKNCVSCHMPKVDVPEMHYAFTDHWIRVLRPGETYRD